MLEEELGVTLFERGRQGMHLTNEGKLLENYARRALKEIEMAKIELSSQAGILTGTVNIGILSSLSEQLAVTIMRAIKEKYPNVNLKITVAYSGHLKEWLEAGDIDLALIYQSIPSKFIESKPMVSEQLWLIGAYDTALKINKPYRLTEIANLPLILPYTPHRLMTLIEQGFSSAKLNFKIAAEVNDLTVQKQLVKEGFGYTILPLISVKNDLQQKTLTAAPIQHSSFTREVALALPNTRHISRLVHVVANEVIQLSQQMVATRDWLGGQWIGEVKP